MSNFPDMVTQFGGVPVGGSRYNGMWGGTVYFVDYDNGVSGAAGTKPTSAGKYLDDAIAAAGANDTIYIRPRPPEAGTTYYGGDPGDILPKTASTNYTISYLKYGLSIIGTGTGLGPAGASRTCLQGDATITSTPVFTVNAPYVTFENLGIKPGASTTGLIKQAFVDASAQDAYANTYYNVWFRNVDAAAGYSLMLDGGSYDNVLNCTFSGHPTGIYLSGTTANNTATTIRNCDFDVAFATVKCDIYSNGTVTRILVNRCNFNHTGPAGGAPNMFISFASASTGLISDCYMGHDDATIANSITANGVTNAHVWGMTAEIT